MRAECMETFVPGLGRKYCSLFCKKAWYKDRDRMKTGKTLEDESDDDDCADDNNSPSEKMIRCSRKGCTNTFPPLFRKNIHFKKFCSKTCADMSYRTKLKFTVVHDFKDTNNLEQKYHPSSHTHQLLSQAQTLSTDNKLNLLQVKTCKLYTCSRTFKSRNIDREFCNVNCRLEWTRQVDAQEASLKREEQKAKRQERFMKRVVGEEDGNLDDDNDNDDTDDNSSNIDSSNDDNENGVTINDVGRIPKRTCCHPNCNIIFEAFPGNKQYCSSVCREHHIRGVTGMRGELLGRVCELPGCSTKFTASFAGHNTRRYCCSKHSIIGGLLKKGFTMNSDKLDRGDDSKLNSNKYCDDDEVGNDAPPRRVCVLERCSNLVPDSTGGRKFCCVEHRKEANKYVKISERSETIAKHRKMQTEGSGDYKSSCKLIQQICKFPGCSNTFEAYMNGGRKYCCLEHSKMGGILTKRQRPAIISNNDDERQIRNDGVSSSVQPPKAIFEMFEYTCQLPSCSNTFMDEKYLPRRHCCREHAKIHIAMSKDFQQFQEKSPVIPKIEHARGQNISNVRKMTKNQETYRNCSYPSCTNEFKAIVHNKMFCSTICRNLSKSNIASVICGDANIVDIEKDEETSSVGPQKRPFYVGVVDDDDDDDDDDDQVTMNNDNDRYNDGNDDNRRNNKRINDDVVFVDTNEEDSEEDNVDSAIALQSYISRKRFRVNVIPRESSFTQENDNIHENTASDDCGTNPDYSVLEQNEMMVYAAEGNVDGNDLGKVDDDSEVRSLQLGGSEVAVLADVDVDPSNGVSIMEFVDRSNTAINGTADDDSEVQSLQLGGSEVAVLADVDVDPSNGVSIMEFVDRSNTAINGTADDDSEVQSLQHVH